METNIEKIKEELKSILSEKRYNHSIGVMKMAAKLAKKYGISEEEAALVGLTHDIAKELGVPKSMQYVKKNKIEIDKIERKTPSLLHAKIGADMVKNKYQFTKDMQNAIKYHTTGNPHMDKLAKVLYVADKTEENRKFKEVEELRKIAMENLDEAVFAILTLDIKKNIDQNRLIHIQSIKTRNALLDKKAKKIS